MGMHRRRLKPALETAPSYYQNEVGNRPRGHRVPFAREQANCNGPHRREKTVVQKPDERKGYVCSASSVIQFLGYPCGWKQFVQRRLDTSFVDRICLLVHPRMKSHKSTLSGHSMTTDRTHSNPRFGPKGWQE